MTMAGGTISAHELRPNLVTLVVGTVAVAAVSALALPWQAAIASTTLGALMIAGADVDARKFLLPDTVTFGTIASGGLAALVLNPSDPIHGIEMASARAVGTALLVALLRWAYAHFRGNEGLGLGDVKLSAGIGAWLPVELIPLCFGFAAIGALVTVTFAFIRGQVIYRTTKVPLGTFLCPALWFVFFLSCFHATTTPDLRRGIGAQPLRERVLNMPSSRTCATCDAGERINERNYFESRGYSQFNTILPKNDASIS